MAGYRVTKYDPRKRNEDGVFIGDDWTSVSDIGKTFNGQVLSDSDYLAAENEYLRSVELFMAAAHLEALRVEDLDVKRRATSLTQIVGATDSEYLQGLRNHSKVSGSVLRDLV